VPSRNAPEKGASRLDTDSVVPELLFVSMTTVDVRQILGTPPRRRICVPAPWYRGSCTPIDASRRQSFAMHSFDQNTRDLLRKSAMFARGTPP